MIRSLFVTLHFARCGWFILFSFDRKRGKVLSTVAGFSGTRPFLSRLVTAATNDVWHVGMEYSMPRVSLMFFLFVRRAVPSRSRHLLFYYHDGIFFPIGSICIISAIYSPFRGRLSHPHLQPWLSKQPSPSPHHQAP